MQKARVVAFPLSAVAKSPIRCENVRSSFLLLGMLKSPMYAHIARSSPSAVRYANVAN